ncbi:MAG: DUF4157 domain-containing protein [Isosphaeraceae bacterium]
MTARRVQAKAPSRLLQAKRPPAGRPAVERLASHRPSAGSGWTGIRGSFSHIPALAGRADGHPGPGLHLPHGPLPWRIQAKLAVGPVDDPLEREADELADHVMRIPDRADVTAAGGEATLRRKCHGCEKDEEDPHEELSRKERPGASARVGSTAPPLVERVLDSPGAPIPEEVRSPFEARFGYDFSKVRIHTGGQAAASARAVDALAYTVGRDIVFGPGQFQPASAEGRRLLAHELAHTIQQGSARPKGHRAASGRAAESASGSDVIRPSGVAHEAAHSVGGPALQRQAAAPGGVDLSADASPFLAAAIGSVTIDHFATGRSEISPDNRARLQEAAGHIVSLLQKYPMSTVLVIGHTDAVGQESDNQKLGMERAEATRDVLVEMGVPPAIIQTESRGETQLLVKTEQSEASNRRVQVLFRPTASPLSPTLPTPTPTPPPTPTPQISADICQQSPELCVKPNAPPPVKPTLPPDFWKPVPPAPKGSAPKSPLDVINEKVDKVVKAVTKGLPKGLQDQARDLAHSAVEKGITAGLAAALGAWGVDQNGQNAVVNAVDAAIHEK